MYTETGFLRYPSTERFMSCTICTQRASHCGSATDGDRVRTKSPNWLIYYKIPFGLDTKVAEVEPHPSIDVSNESKVYKAVKPC